MKVKTVKVAKHPDLVPRPEWSEEIGKDEKSLQRDARLGIGPPAVRIGNRVYYWRPQCEQYLRELFERAEK